MHEAYWRKGKRINLPCRVIRAHKPPLVPLKPAGQAAGQAAEQAAPTAAAPDRAEALATLRRQVGELARQVAEMAQTFEALVQND